MVGPTFIRPGAGFWSYIENDALPMLVRCVNENYLPEFTIEDLEIEFSANRKGSTSYGNGKIIFGPFHGAPEYAMFKGDKDLWADTSSMEEGGYTEFRAWYLTAHELAHEVVDRVCKLCTEINEPIIPNLSKKLGIRLDLGEYPTLKDLVVNQAWWKRMGSKRSDIYSQRLYTLNYDDKAFKHGVFYQHIYRTLRREVVNPKFGIHVGDWKQKSKPKKYPWSVN